ncbi:hypothetical protein KFE94_00870 [bacterium SCSIO 12643]|nr:hypothetical protein KFE94_00870 [bacterium SCSIO 12643]
MDRVYTIKPNAFERHKKKYMRTVLILMIFAVLAGLGIAYLNSNDHSMDMYTYPFVIMMASAIMFFTIKKQLKRQEEIFYSYQLTIEENQIVREQMNLPTVTIPFNEIIEIIEGTADLRVLTVKSDSETILIHSGVEDYDEIKRRLEDVHSITPFQGGAKSWMEKNVFLVTIITLLAFATTYLASNKYVVIISGTFSLAVLSFGFYEIYTNKNIDPKVKKKMWWGIPVVYSILATIYYKLTGTL